MTILSYRKHRTRVNNWYSTWFEILFGVAQGFILGPLIFTTFNLILENMQMTICLLPALMTLMNL